ncbi:MAG: hypothetical protein GY869_30095, partial [Planctomycetes bacterium]|nr:hypothetical protein [Planctomycetota bacterium]
TTLKTRADSNACIVYALWGPLEQNGHSIDLSTQSPDLSIKLPTNENSPYCHLEVSDLDGDGIADIIVSDPYLEVNSLNEAGAVYIFFGRTDPPPTWHIDWTATSPDLTLIFPFRLSRLGEALGTGDYNGDGFADLFVSSRFNLTEGAVFTLLGPFEYPGGDTLDLYNDLPDLMIWNIG